MGRITLPRIEEAWRRIAPEFLHTPQYVCEPLGAELGVELLLKVETLNPVRSFKGRGACWLMAAVPPGSRIVCASAGNFGQALAWAARGRQVAVTVFASRHANEFKLQRMRALGATVVLQGEDFDAAREAAQVHAQATGERLVVDSLDVETAEGAGTIALELLQSPRALDALLVPLGNGAVCAGIAHAFKARGSATQVFGVQAAGASAMADSWEAGRPVVHATMATIADGIATRVPIPQALDDLRGALDGVLRVRDETIVQAMRRIHLQAGLVVEPSAAVGVAALLEDPARWHGRRVGVILCGGNLTPQQLQDWL